MCGVYLHLKITQILSDICIPKCTLLCVNVCITCVSMELLLLMQVVGAVFCNTADCLFYYVSFKTNMPWHRAGGITVDFTWLIQWNRILDQLVSIKISVAIMSLCQEKSRCIFKCCCVGMLYSWHVKSLLLYPYHHWFYVNCLSKLSTWKFLLSILLYWNLT
jgi:hypothetical protein